MIKALGDSLPTASVRDTEQTRDEVGLHRKVFFAICETLEIECE